MGLMEENCPRKESYPRMSASVCAYVEIDCEKETEKESEDGC